MFIRLPTPKGDYCVNLTKVVFFYAYKECTRFEMDDGTVIDFNATLDEVTFLFNQLDYHIPRYNEKEDT